MCLLTETRALSAEGEKRALVGNLTMPIAVNGDDGKDTLLPWQLLLLREHA